MIKLENNEKIITHVRKHWFIMFSEGIVLLFLSIIPPLGIMIIGNFLNTNITASAFFLGLSFYGIWLLFLWILFFLAWTDHYLDVWIITDQRIISVEQRGIFNRKVSRLRLDRVQDVTVKVQGILATFLTVGVLIVQTAGQNIKIVFSGAGKPYEAKEIISRLQHQAKEETN